jgi:hypothetical protein
LCLRLTRVASTHIKRVSGSTRVDLSKSAATRAATQTFKPFKTAICSTTLTSKVNYLPLQYTRYCSTTSGIICYVTFYRCDLRRARGNEKRTSPMRTVTLYWFLSLILCLRANGTQFTIPVDPKMKPPKIGSVITFTYDKLKGPNHVPTDAKVQTDFTYSSSHISHSVAISSSRPLLG